MPKSYTSPEEIVRKVIAADKRCRYACLLDPQASKLSDLKRGTAASHFEKEVAALENIRTTIRYGVAQSRSSAEPLLGTLTLYEEYCMLTTKVGENVLLVAVDLILGSELVEKILELTRQI